MGKVVDTLVLDNEEDFQKMLHKLAEEILDESAKDKRKCKGSVNNHTPSVKSHAFQVMFDLMDFIEQTDLDLWVAEVLESVETIEELWKLKDSLAEHIRSRSRVVPPGSIDKAW